MAEYKNGVSALGNVSVTKDDTAAEVRTGRVVFVDEDKYENDAAYKAKVDKCVEEGFHRVSEDGSSSGGGSGSGGGTPLIVKASEGTEGTLDHTWQEIVDAPMAWLEVADGDNWQRYLLTTQGFQSFRTLHSVSFNDVGGSRIFSFTANSADGYPASSGIG